MLKTAIIGISGYGREHLRLLLFGYERELLEPCAAVVINPEQVPSEVSLLKEVGCRIYADVESMWAEESGKLDLCMIPSSIATHHPFTKMALENGCHVFVEKPICGSVQEANAICALAEELNLKICVGFQDIYSPQVQDWKRRVLKGDLGKIRQIKSWGSWPRPTKYFQRNDWAGKLQIEGKWVLDSPVNNAMAHFLMLMLYWAGNEENSFAEVTQLEADLYRAQAIESFDTASMRLKTSSGVDVFYAVTHSSNVLEHPIVRIEGEKGWCQWNLFKDIRWEIEGESGSVPTINIDRLREKMIEDVHSWISTDTGKVVKARDAVIHARVVSALHASTQIVDFPLESIRKAHDPDTQSVYVEGLYDDMREAFRSGRLLHEVRPDVYRAPEIVFPVGHFNHFSGIPAAGTSAVTS